jgi:hypothetical protein
MKHFTCELYSQDFYFCPGFTASQLCNAVKSELKYDLGELVIHKTEYGLIFFIPDKYESIVIWTKTNSSKSSISALAHESTHAAMKVLKSRGVKLHPSNDEPLCYMVEFIFNKCLRHMKFK